MTSKETSPANTPVHSIHQNEDMGASGAASAIINMHMHSPQKPVNLLPELPEMRSSGRTLSEREKRDCQVIGKTYIFLDYYK